MTKLSVTADCDEPVTQPSRLVCSEMSPVKLNTSGLVSVVA